MNNRYRHAHITSSGNIPAVTDFSGPGELIVNIPDGRAFTLDYSNNVVQLGGPIISASYALTASYAANAGAPISASYATSASWAPQLPVVSSSYATTSSAATSLTFIPVSASYATSASWAPSVAASSNGVFGGDFSGSFSGSHSGSFTGNYLLTSVGVVTPPSGTLDIYAKNFSTIVMPTYADATSSFPFARHMGYTQFFRLYAGKAAIVDELGTPQSQGTAPTFTGATGSSFQPIKSYTRWNYAPATGPGTWSGISQAQAVVMGAYGYQVVTTFTVDNWSNANARLFVGLSSTISVAGFYLSASVNGVTHTVAANASASNCIGILKENTDTNFQIVTSSSGSLTKTDSGAQILANGVYRLTIGSNVGDSGIGVQVEQIGIATSSVLFNQIMTLTLPPSASNMGMQIGVGCSTSAVSTISIVHGTTELWH